MNVVARIARGVRPLRAVRGWNRLVDALCPPARGNGSDFEVDFYGYRFRGDLGRHIDRHVFFFGGYERDELEFVQRWWARRDGGVALDVGANIGQHTLALSRIFGTVHAFEPNPGVIERLEFNLRSNRVPNAVVHRCGLWNADRELPFNLPPERNSGMGSFKDAVPEMPAPLALAVRRGDGVLQQAGVERIDFIKIDVQGAEAEVLEGLRSTLARSRPLVWIEISATTRHDIPTFARLVALLGGHAFEAVRLVRASPLFNRLREAPLAPADYPRFDGNLFLRPVQ